MDVQKARRDQCARTGLGGGRALTEQFHIQAAFLFCFAQRGDLGIFIQFDMTTKRQPFVELAMMDQKDPAIVHDKNRHGKINLLMDVRHTGETLSTEGQGVKSLLAVFFVPAGDP